LPRSRVCGITAGNGDMVGRQTVIDNRQVIQALLRKPGAFARYHYREELFPSSAYRRADDRLVQDHGMGAANWSICACSS